MSIIIITKPLTVARGHNIITSTPLQTLRSYYSIEPAHDGEVVKRRHCCNGWSVAIFERRGGKASYSLRRRLRYVTRIIMYVGAFNAVAVATVEKKILYRGKKE